MSFCLLKDKGMRHSAVVKISKCGLDIQFAVPLGRRVLELHPRLVPASNNRSVRDAISLVKLTYRAKFFANGFPFTIIVLALPGINAWIGSAVSIVVKG